MVARQTDQIALVTRKAVASRFDAIRDQAAFLLDRLTHDLRITSSDPAVCQAALDASDASSLRGLVGLAVIAPDGRVRCADGVPAIRAELLTAELPAVFLADTGAVLTLSSPVSHAGENMGRIRGAVRIDAPRLVGREPATPVMAWLVQSDGRAVPLDVSASGSAEALPESMAAINGSAVPLMARGADGQLYSYAAARVTPALQVLVAVPADKTVAGARAVLIRRLGELGLGLLIGIILVAVGASHAVVAPLRRVIDAVRRWREGGPFDAIPDAAAPAELQELTRSFGEATEALTKRETQLRAAMTQQDLLMQEIHHRVKNNLQVVASLLNLQASRIRLPEAKAEFQSARDRVRALATLHRHLYAYGEVHTINMRSFLKELCGQLLQAMGGTDRITLNIEASELQISSDQAVPMALIVTEAVSNAAKYAFPGGRRGKITVRLITERDVARLVIEDDGIGIPAGRIETETGIRDGIGLQLIRGFARQLGATLTVTEDLGTRYDVELRLRRSAAREHATELLAEDGAEDAPQAAG
jgi:two-component sensor histidine kinase